MKRYVKGFMFVLALSLITVRSFALVIAPVILISVVKLIVALVSILSVPLSGLVHFFVKGSLKKKILAVITVLAVIGLSAYLILSNFLPTDFNFNQQSFLQETISGSLSYENKSEVKGDSTLAPGMQNKLQIPSNPNKLYPPGAAEDMTWNFIKLLIIGGLIFSLVISTVFYTLGYAYLKISKKRIVLKDLTLKSLSVGSFLGFLSVFIAMMFVYKSLISVY